MTYSKAFSTIRSRTGIGLAALAAAAVIAGCGSSGSSSTITVGNESSADNTLAKSTEKAVKTPTSGPLSKAPTITPPSTPAPSKLETKDLITGTGREATVGETVTVNDVGVLYKTGKEFESSFKRNEPFTFTLGKSQVIPGWEQGVVGMKVGGRRELIIPASLAYGSKGSGTSIPANSPLIFVIDLLGA